ncbi:ABC transporter ATP-binding protein [Phytohabitans rumicis]|uniref:ABC transporter ATP-binding protein n=1 Tax=Phytohabitans rumicis TaxID=1076125 RepID=A0A6V8L9N2_9ACTN|nr:ATP-binding cassette domain-containing protein [Phytohabitans rumicis]GFJ93024.1 ABC transporter ATP-binding protein [Phytohabitans rumicis]
MNIVARDLTKIFHTIVRRPGFIGGLTSLVAPARAAKTAVDGVSFSVDEGELLAFLGPNGAGKSTTIKMLTGILVPSSGEVEVAGIAPHRDRERNARNIGAVFGQRTQLWWDLPARESLAILRDIFNVNAEDYRRRLREFDELLELSEFWDTRVRHLSLGQRVRCDLAAALLHDPRIVFLDEPTIGMDVVVKEQVREFLRYQVDKRGRTVVLTTHDMTEVDKLAERMVLINHGRLVFDGSLAELRTRFGDTWQVHVTLAEPPATGDVEVPGLRVLRQDGPRFVFGPGDGATSPQDALRRIIERYAITDLAIEENDLEDVMRLAYLQHRSDLDVPA